MRNGDGEGLLYIVGMVKEDIVRTRRDSIGRYCKRDGMVKKDAVVIEEKEW